MTGMRMLTRTLKDHVPRIMLVLLLLGCVSAPAFASVSLDGTVDAQPDFVGQRIDLILPDLKTERVALSFGHAKGSDQLRYAEPGDKIAVTLDNGQQPKAIQSVDYLARPVTIATLVSTFVGALGLIIFLASLATGWRPLSFIIGADNRFSNSQTQLALWFATVAAIYTTAVVLRLVCFHGQFVGGVGLPEHLIELTGLSALSFGSAKVITEQKIANAKAAGILSPKPSAARPNFIRDLVMNDSGDADLGDFQMLLITATAVIVFVISAMYFLGTLAPAPSVTLPDVDTTLLASFGIGQGAYLMKKAAVDVGKG